MGECVLTSRHGEITTEILTPASNLSIGETVSINIDGEPYEFIVVHQGLPSSGYDASCNGTWLLMKDIYTLHHFTYETYNEEYDWYDGDPWEYSKYTKIAECLNDIYNKIDPTIKQSIVTANIPSQYYYDRINGSDYDPYYKSSVTAMPVFLLSTAELGCGTTQSNGSKYYDYYQEGDTLDYFTYGHDSAANSRRIAFYNSTATSWWTRTNGGGERYCAYIQANGSDSSAEGNYYFGVRPAIIVPFDTKFAVSLLD